MDNVRKLVREGLLNHLHEAEGKKKEDIVVPQGCFGGPKHGLGALVNIVELLMREKDSEVRKPLMI